MSAPVFLITLALVLGSIVGVFDIRYRAISKQAKAKLADAQEWREIAERAAAAEAQTAAAMASVQASLGELSARLLSVETLLKDVG